MTHKIKSAIILAAGRGSRLSNMTDDIPKPLLKVRGEVLIERLIKQLQAKGIDDIYIVTGYKHQMFEYLEHMFGVECIYNKKWFCTNNIVSFCRGYLTRSHYSKNLGTIMLDGDLYITNPDIIQTSIETSGYYVEYCDDAEKCTKEWVVSMCGVDNRHITGVTIDGTKKSGYILRSLSYWTPMDLNRVYTYARDKLFEGVLMQEYIDAIPCIYYATDFMLRPYVCEPGSLLEIDTELDYNDANKEIENEEN